MTAIVQPDSYVNYSPFTSSAPFLPAGTYTLYFEGLNPNGGDNTAFIDAIILNGSSVPNGSFESPVISDYCYENDCNSTPQTWSFVGDSGIAANGGDVAGGAGNAPDGNQTAFVQKNGIMSQDLTLSSGAYTLAFKAEQRYSYQDSFQQLRVNLRATTPGIVTRRFVWAGNRIAEERDGTGATVVKRFFAEGEQRIGGSDAGNYYYTRDHLGSIREITNASGTLKGRYDYDPYGGLSVSSGALNLDFGYTGHFNHQRSGLNLSMYRAYSPTSGRWISRDPLENAEMIQGPNLYAYLGNDPINKTDPTGLYTLDEAAAQQIGSYVENTQRAIRIITYLHNNSDLIDYETYSHALRNAGFGDAGLAGIGATNSRTRATAITEAINAIERSPTLTMERYGGLFVGLASDGLYGLIGLHPNSALNIFSYQELQAHNLFLEKLLDIQEQLLEAGLLKPKCP